MSQGIAMVMPVGEYGPEFATKLLHTTQYSMLHATALTGEASELAKGHEVVLKEYTARGRDIADLGSGSAEGLVNTVEEGVLTIAQAAALITAEKVQGYDDPMVLLQDIQAAGLINKLTSTIRMGIAGPFTMAGVYFPGLVQNHDGELRLNPDVMRTIQDAKRAQVQHAVGEWATRTWRRHKGSDDLKTEKFQEELFGRMGIVMRNGALGMICPAARRGGGLRDVSGAMIDTMAAIK